MIKQPVRILYAEDDPEDRMLVLDAMSASKLANPVDTVADGVELLAYLRREGRFADREDELPGLILLDLNMPRMDGREALREIRQDERFRRIPVIVLTTSKAEEDILRSYDLGVNSFVVKPVTFEALIETVRALGRFWFEIVELPS